MGNSERIQRAISLGIAADTTEARNQLNQMFRTLKSVKDPTADLQKQMRLLRLELEANLITDRDFQRATAKIEEAANRQRQTIAELTEQYKKLSAAKQDAARQAAFVGPGREDMRYQDQERKRRAHEGKIAREAARQRVLSELDAERAAGAEALKRRKAVAEQIRRAGIAQQQVGPGRQDLEYNRQRLIQQDQESIRITAEKRRQEARAHKERLHENNVARADSRKNVLAQLEEQRAAGQAARAAREARLASSRAAASMGPNRADLDYGRNMQALQSIGPSRRDFEYGQDWRLRQQQARDAMNPPVVHDPQRDMQRRGHQYMAQFDTALEGRNRRRMEAETMFRQGAITGQEYAKALRTISRETSLVHQGTLGLRSAMTLFTHPLVLAAAALEGLRRSIMLAADLEKARVKFEVFTGSAEEATRILGELRKLSQTSPISFSGAQKATTTLLQFGVAAKDVVRSVRNIGEITGGDAERMQNLSLAFAQSAAAGRLMGQELLQMVNAGFNPLKVIAKETGKDLTQLREEMSQGLISFDMVDAAFRKQAKDYATLDKISKTAAGSLQLFNSRLEELGTSVGLALPVQTALDGINQSLGDMAMLIRDATSAFGELNGVLKDTGISMPKGLNGVSILAQGVDLVKFLRAVQDDGRGISEDQKKAAVETYDRMQQRSGGWFDLGKTARGKQIEEWRKELKRLAEEAEKAEKSVRTLEQTQADVDKSFAEPIEKLKKEIQSAKYGEDAYTALSALVGGLWGTDRSKAQLQMDRATDSTSALAAMRASVDDKNAFDTALRAYNKLIAMQAQVKANKDAIAAATEKEKKAADDLRKANDALSRLSEDATKISKANDPNSAYVDGVARATAAYVEGLLSSTELTAEKNRLLDEAVKSNKSETSRIAPSLRVGSQEAYSALVRASDAAQTRRDQLQQRVTTAAETQNAIGRETNRLLLEVKDANLGDGG